MAKSSCVPIDATHFLSRTSHLKPKEVAKFAFLLFEAWERKRNPVPKAKELAPFHISRDSCKRIIRYDLHPSAWPQGRWKTVRKAVLLRDGHVCSYCGNTDGPFDVDHIVPRSRGGKNTSKNLTVACYSCNRKKGAKTPQEWRGDA